MTPLEKELVKALEGVERALALGDVDAYALQPETADRLNGVRCGIQNLLARAKQTGTREFTVTDDGHGRAMVGGKRLAYGGKGVEVDDLYDPPERRVRVGTRVRVELRDGCDFATLVEVLHGT